MIVAPAATGQGLNIILSLQEGRVLALLLSCGGVGSGLRDDLLRQLGAMLEQDEDRYVDLARRQDARSGQYDPGWIVTIREALDDKRINSQVADLVGRLTRNIGSLMDQARTPAGPAQAGRNGRFHGRK